MYINKKMSIDEVKSEIIEGIKNLKKEIKTLKSEKETLESDYKNLQSESKISDESCNQAKKK